MTILRTGRDLTVVIDSDTYTAQVTNVALSTAPNQVTVETLAARNYKTIDNQSTLTVDILQDWGAVSSLCEGLANAYQSAPDTSLAFTLTIAGGTASGNLFPIAPDFGGASLDVLAATLSFVVDGDITYA